GCLGAFATGIGATEMAAVWATGKLWFRVPETIKITINGSFPAGVYAKDLILFIVGKLTAEGANYKSVEFYGDTVRKMSISERFTLANLSMEMGAKSAIVPFDKVTEKYLAGVTDNRYQPVYADEGSVYEEEYEFDVGCLRPQVACPHKVDNVKPIDEVLGVKIQQALLGSCTNGRLDDLEIAAKILQGKRIHSDVRMLIFPGSRDIYLEALKKGYIKIFLEAGSVVMNPGCGPCLGAHEGILADGERCIATTNRNFRGRMGSSEAEVYLASPATVAASALKGKIVSAASTNFL
ncbi:MAG: aconitase/3-isopropylmalate dehydratase large subunit family protein, partial [Candidatus Zixiibacteriota bacterium]